MSKKTLTTILVVVLVIAAAVAIYFIVNKPAETPAPVATEVPVVESAAPVVEETVTATDAPAEAPVVEETTEATQAP